MNIVIVIPARYNSRRYPGKALVEIYGRSVLNRTWSIACAVQHVAAVHIATEDERVAEHARAFGASVIMTSPDCRNGTERVYQAVRRLSERPDAVVNVQGDAVLTPPWVVQALVDVFLADSSVHLVTAATQCSWRQYGEIEAIKSVSPTSGTLVTFDKNGNALYFSKSMIPYLRMKDADPPPVYRHIGVYGYRYDALEELASLEQTPLERAEQLEQLRALENDIPVRVILVDYRNRTHWSVDTPEDVAKVKAIIDKEGELLAVVGENVATKSASRTTQGFSGNADHLRSPRQHL